MRSWVNIWIHWCAVSGLKVESKRDLWNGEGSSYKCTCQWVGYSSSRAFQPPNRERIPTEEVVEGSGIFIPILIIRNYDVLLQIQPEFQWIFHVIEGLAALANFNSNRTVFPSFLKNWGLIPASCCGSFLCLGFALFLYIHFLTQMA